MKEATAYYPEAEGSIEVLRAYKPTSRKGLWQSVQAERSNQAYKS